METGRYPSAGRHFIATICMHCENPPCEAVCPSGATYIGEGGTVLVDDDRCMGCKACLAACPYGARYVYGPDEVAEARLYFQTAEPQHASAHVDKCTFCADRVSQGMEPACVGTCVGGARIFGDLDDPRAEVSRLVASGLARPLRPELGTKPKVYYIY